MDTSLSCCSIVGYGYQCIHTLRHIKATICVYSYTVDSTVPLALHWPCTGKALASAYIKEQARSLRGNSEKYTVQHQRRAALQPTKLELKYEDGLPEVLTYLDVAEALGLKTTQGISRLIKTGELTAIGVSRSRRITTKSFLAHLERVTVRPQMAHLLISRRKKQRASSARRSHYPRHAIPN
jgi:hypothetical protein